MTGKKRATAGDLKKGNEHALRKEDRDDIPELTDTDFARGVWHRNGKPLPPGPLGRPKSKNPKRPVSIRLDPDVLSHFRRSGRGWQSRINAGCERSRSCRRRNGKPARRASEDLRFAAVPRALRKLTAVIAVNLSCLAAGYTRATATTLRIVPPWDVMLYVHAEFVDTDFVEPLVCALRQVLTANVDVKEVSLPLGPRYSRHQPSLT